MSMKQNVYNFLKTNEIKITLQVANACSCNISPNDTATKL